MPQVNGVLAGANEINQSVALVSQAGEDNKEIVVKIRDFSNQFIIHSPPIRVTDSLYATMLPGSFEASTNGKYPA